MQTKKPEVPYIFVPTADFEKMVAQGSGILAMHATHGDWILENGPRYFDIIDQGRSERYVTATNSRGLFAGKEFQMALALTSRVNATSKQMFQTGSGRRADARLVSSFHPFVA
ncbi:MAG: hypothetical protein HY053_07070 [Proteobacteria bacterium]|nr:hypothetical protein [Pseudomonadota bacterium]